MTGVTTAMQRLERKVAFTTDGGLTAY